VSQEFRPAPMSLAQRAALRAQAPYQQSVTPRERRNPTFVVVLLFVVIVLAVLVGGFEYLYRDRIYPRVVLRPISLNLGGLTPANAATDVQLAALRGQQMGRRVLLHMPTGHVITVPVFRLGYTVDRPLTMWRAYSIGHIGSPLEQARAQIGVLTHGATVSLAQTVTSATLRRYLIALGNRYDRAPTHSEAGARLDVSTTVRLLTAALYRVSAADIALTVPFVDIPPR